MINPDDAPDGYVAVAGNPEMPSSCDGCAFQDKYLRCTSPFCGNYDPSHVSCYGTLRKDETLVIFKKKELPRE